MLVELAQEHVDGVSLYQYAHAFEDQMSLHLENWIKESMLWASPLMTLENEIIDECERIIQND